MNKTEYYEILYGKKWADERFLHFLILPHVFNLCTLGCGSNLHCKGPIKPGAELFARLFIIFEAVMTPCDWSVDAIKASDWLIHLHVIYVLKEP